MWANMNKDSLKDCLILFSCGFVFLTCKLLGSVILEAQGILVVKVPSGESTEFCESEQCK